MLVSDVLERERRWFSLLVASEGEPREERLEASEKGSDADMAGEVLEPSPYLASWVDPTRTRMPRR